MTEAGESLKSITCCCVVLLPFAGLAVFLIAASVAPRPDADEEAKRKRQARSRRRGFDVILKPPNDGSKD